MKPITKQARGNLASTLEKHKGALMREIDSNAWEIKKLAEQQQVLKRQRKELDQIIHELRT